MTKKSTESVYQTIENFTHNGYRVKLIMYRGAYALEAANLNVLPRRLYRRWVVDVETVDDARAEFFRIRDELKRVGFLDRIFASGVSDWIDLFLKHSKINSISFRTYQSHLQSMKQFRVFIAEKKIEKLTPLIYEDLKEWLLAQGRSNRTVDIRLSAISAMITVMEDLGIIQRGQITRPKLIRAKRSKLPTFWDRTEIDAVVRAAGSRYIRDMILLGLNTGLRRIELVYLRWDDINLESGFLTVQGYEIDHHGKIFSFEPKDHEFRRIKLNSRASALLASIRETARPVPWVFANSNGNPRLDLSVLNRDLRQVIQKAGVKKTGWHTLRRTFAVHLLMAGANLESIRQLLGHSDLSTTQVYLNVTDKHLDQTVDLVDLGDFGETENVVPFKTRT